MVGALPAAAQRGAAVSLKLCWGCAWGCAWTRALGVGDRPLGCDGLCGLGLQRQHLMGGRLRPGRCVAGTPALCCMKHLEAILAAGCCSSSQFWLPLFCHLDRCGAVAATATLRLPLVSGGVHGCAAAAQPSVVCAWLDWPGVLHSWQLHRCCCRGHAWLVQPAPCCVMRPWLLFPPGYVSLGLPQVTVTVGRRAAYLLAVLFTLHPCVSVTSCSLQSPVGGCVLFHSLMCPAQAVQQLLWRLGGCMQSSLRAVSRMVGIQGLQTAAQDAVFDNAWRPVLLWWVNQTRRCLACVSFLAVVWFCRVGTGISAVALHQVLELTARQARL
ncbi:hypothetical protein COO60DRAFT_446163 [Scenedesmus sp. NREL 46B-D3]|nr:hypothetical protein COO60DRAFT_446163 [Scenedesmus sp. NREL 46B-D3]